MREAAAHFDARALASRVRQSLNASRAACFAMALEAAHQTTPSIQVRDGEILLSYAPCPAGARTMKEDVQGDGYGIEMEVLEDGQPTLIGVSMYLE